MCLEDDCFMHGESILFTNADRGVCHSRFWFQQDTYDTRHTCGKQ